MEGYPATAACSRGGDSNLSYRITNPSFNTHNIALGLIHLSPSLAYGSMYLLETERAKSSCTGSSFMEISHPKMFCHELTVYKGDRIAAYFVKWLGKSTLRLSYGLALSEALIAPAMPNTMARVGGREGGGAGERGRGRGSGEEREGGREGKGGKGRGGGGRERLQ
ncbi:hypothetical protein KY285_009189 [Solanum tuberosum]|nr:hypothetical protein KY285_009189 [Solanum tuberosum]